MRLNPFFKKLLILVLIFTVSIFCAQKVVAGDLGRAFEAIIMVVVAVVAIAVVVSIATVVVPAVSTAVGTVGNVVGGIVDVAMKVKGVVDSAVSGDPLAMANSFGFSPTSFLGDVYKNTIGNVLPIPNVNLPKIDKPAFVQDAENFYNAGKKVYDTGKAIESEAQAQAQAETEKVQQSAQQAIDNLPKPDVRLSGPSLPSAPGIPTISMNINIDFGDLLDNGYWDMKLVPVYGNYIPHSDKMNQVLPGNYITLGLVIKDDHGNFITQKEDLKGYIPVYTRIPLPAGSKPVGIIYPRKQPLPDESIIPITQGYAYKFYGYNKVLGVPEGKVPDVILGATPTIIPYSINQEVREVAINIYDLLGNRVATYANSAPSPDNPIPFIWNGKYIGRDWFTDQKEVSKGRYNAVLVAKLKDYSTVESAPININVLDKSSDTTNPGDPNKVAANEFPNNAEGYFYGFISVQNPEKNLSGGLEKLYVWLHSGSQDRPLSKDMFLNYSIVDTQQSYFEITYRDEDTEKLRTSQNEFRWIMGQEAAGFQTIKIYVVDQNKKPVVGQKVKLVSSRNQGDQGIDFIFPIVAETNDKGIAFFTVWTETRTMNEEDEVPDEEKYIHLYVEVDGLWLKQIPAGHARTIKYLEFGSQEKNEE